MNLVQIGILYLTLFALADGIWNGGILILIIFIAALAQQLNQQQNQCPANYTPTPNDPSSCIRFFTSPTKNFTNAEAACVSDGGELLKLNTATFPLIQQLAQNNGGTCSYWVGATEDVPDGSWEDLNGVPIPTTLGIFFILSTNTFANDGGLMSKDNSFFLVGEAKAEENCYICQKG